MADDSGFDLGLGTDPFGGGAEGLPDIPAAGKGFDLPNFAGTPPGGSQGGLMDFAKGLTGGGGKSSSGGILGDIGSGLGSVAKGILPVAQLGLGGLGVKNQLDAASLAKKQAGQFGQMQQIQRESTQPLQQFGATQLNRAQAGQVDPAIQAQIDQWAQAQKVKIQQFFASNGITDSTMLQSAIADIDAKAVAMKAGNLQMMEQLGIGALSSAANAAGGGAQTASREQTQLDSLIAESNRALAALTGSVG